MPHLPPRRRSSTREQQSTCSPPQAPAPESSSSSSSSSFTVVVRKTGAGVLFGQEVVGLLADVVYSADARYVVRVTRFFPDEGFHQVESLLLLDQQLDQDDPADEQSWNFAARAVEEAFTDVVDLSLLHRSRKLQFLQPAGAALQLQLQQQHCVQCVHCNLQCVAGARPGVLCDVCVLPVHSHCCQASASASASSRLCPGCAKKKNVRPTAVLLRTPRGDFPALERLSAEFLELQTPQTGRTRRVLFMEGARYLREVCQNSLGVALQSLRGCATNGVLTWTPDSENVKLLRAALASQQQPQGERQRLVLVVAVLELHPVASDAKGRTRDVHKVASVAAHRTFGFVVLRAPGEDQQRGEDGWGSVALFGSRASHVRSLDELWGVLTESQTPPDADSHWRVLDERSGTFLQVDTLKPEFSEYQTKQGSRQVLHALSGSAEIRRANFECKNFRLVHGGQAAQPGNFIAEFVASPARLLLGFALRLLQEMQTRVVLLELALPISGVVKHHGQGRKVEVVLRARAPAGGGDEYMPQRGDRALEITANASAYKIYRAFGFGEHLVFNRVKKANQLPEFLYPVLGCVLETSDARGGVTAAKIVDVATRKTSSLRGFSGWLASLETADESHLLVKQLRDFDLQETTTDDRKFLQELHLFEQILDKLSPHNIGVAEEEIATEESPAYRDHAYSCSVSSVASTSAPSTPVLAKNKNRSMSLTTEAAEHAAAVRRSCRLASKAKDRELILSRQTSYPPFLRS